MTMTYYAAEKVVPNYNVMALAKAALESATRYLAANLGPKNIGGFESQFLLVGFGDENGAVCLIASDPPAPNGQKLF